MKKKAVLLVSVLCLFLLGIEAGGFQISLLKIAQQLNLRGSQNGLLVASQYSAIIIMPAILGSVADRIGKQKVLLTSGLLFSLGCFMTAGASGYGAALLGVFVIGTGYSVCESLASAMLTDAYGELSGKYVSLVQCFFSLGAVLSPQLMEFGTKSFGWGWDALFYICGFSFLLLMVFFFAGLLKNRHEEQKSGLSGKSPNVLEHPGELAVSKIRLSRGFFLLTAAFFIYGGLEVGISYYMDSYLSMELDRPDLSAGVLSLFWLFMIPSRIAGGLLYRFKDNLLWICFGGSAVLLAMIVFAPNEGLVCGALALAGLFLGPIWPGLMSLGVGANRNNTGLAAGILSTGCGLGAVLFPLLLGFSVDWFGLRKGFLCLMVMCALGFVLCLVYCIRMRHI